MELANSFTITGHFDAETVAIRQDKSVKSYGRYVGQNDTCMKITFAPGHAEKIDSIRDGQTVAAAGKITFPHWNQAYSGPDPQNPVLDLTQITITYAKPQPLDGFFEAKLVGWEEWDGMFAICETADESRIYCLVPPIHERLAESTRHYLVGSYVQMQCHLEGGDVLRAHRLREISVPAKETLLLPPNKACQAWDDFTAQGWPQARNRKVSPKLRREVFMRDGFKCRECGASPDKNHAFLEVDHIIPFSRGGSCSISNLQTLCSECNAGKSDGMPHPAALASLQLA